jgi:TetR/AcrR family transcriptional regulator
MKRDLSTSAKIKEAAKNVFLLKGFSGCSSREIATAAGENVALVNYYFRSKGKLFEQIFQSVIEESLSTMIVEFGSDLPLREKMRIFIKHEYAFLKKHPEIPFFILNEMNREDGFVLDTKAIMSKISETGIFEEILQAQKAGTMREISLVGIITLIMSNCQFPFMAKKLICQLLDINKEEYPTNLDNHEQYVTDMLLDYFFITNTNK